MEKKLKRLKKLKLLKEVAAAQRQSLKLTQEQHINLIQTKMMEQELTKLKEHLSTLEEKRNELLAKRDALEPYLEVEEASDDNEEA